MFQSWADLTPNEVASRQGDLCPTSGAWTRRVLRRLKHRTIHGVFNGTTFELYCDLREEGGSSFGCYAIPPTAPLYWVAVENIEGQIRRCISKHFRGLFVLASERIDEKLDTTLKSVASI